MMLGPAIIARLEADPNVTALVDDRVYWLVRPQGSPLPALVVQIISEERTQHLKGFDDAFEATVQVAAQAERYSLSRQLAEAAVAALIDVAEVDDADGSSVVFWRGSVDGPRDLGGQEETRFVHRAVVDLVIRYRSVAAPPPPLVPLAVADFKAGVYELDGVACAFDDLFADPLPNVVPGVGWTLAIAAGGTDSNRAYPSPALSAAMLANGYTAKARAKFTSGGPTGIGGGVSFAVEHKEATGLGEYINVSFYNDTDGTNALFVYDYDQDPIGYDYDLETRTPIASGTLFSIVASILKDGLAMSVDGNPTTSITDPWHPTSIPPGAFYIGAFQTMGDAVATVESLTIYPPQPLADLPAISGPDGAARKATSVRRSKAPRPDPNRRRLRA